ncbi:protein CNPPD1-like [Babylonia areolata]|uniref:protein CNPPD1-like n=1 Tax=Babylonia areolata TaxID=304850 RepID=UPI003FD4D858
MDQNFRKRLQKTMYSGELESAHSPLVLTELAVEFYQEMTPCETEHLDLETASNISSQETVSPASMVLSMMYARRLKRKWPDRPRKLSSSDLFLISMMMASKYLYDEGVDEEVFNDEWAENAGMDEKELNNMELDFLDALDWELFIRKEDFERAMLSVEKSIAVREGLKRSWFSYTDLCLLLDDTWGDLSLSGAVRDWVKVMVLGAAVYCMAVLSCALTVNIGLALTSSALTPTSPPKTPTIPAVMQQLSFGPPPPPPSIPALKLPKHVHDLTSTAFQNYEMGDELEEGGVSNSHLEKNWFMAEVTVIVSAPGNDDLLLEERSAGEEVKSASDDREEGAQTTAGRETILNAILSQLMAVLTLRSHVVQFVFAVSDSYMAGTCRNLSTDKTLDANVHGCVKSSAGGTNTERIGLAQDDNDDNTDALHRFPLDEGTRSDEEGSGPCLHCHRGQWSGREVRADEHGASLLDDQLLHNSWWWRGTGRRVKGAERDERGGRVTQCQRSCPDHHTRVVQSRGGCQCEQSDVTSTVRHSFPDVVIGFSTSVPASMYTA